MGQGHSAQAQHVSIEQLSQRLTQRFANQCYTPLELYCFNSVFKSLADTESGVKYWSEATLCRFLELPDSLGVGPVIYQMATYLGAFPFPSQAPAILTAENLLKVITILTERYRGVLKRGRRDWYREIYRSLAVYDRGAGTGNVKKTEEKNKLQEEKGTNYGFAVDEAVEDEGEAEEDDELVLAAFESMEAIDAFQVVEKANVHHSIIPSDNFLKLLELLLLVAPMEAQESPSIYAANLSDTRLEGLRRTANSILSSFGVEKNHGITYRTFDSVVSSTLPWLMNGLNPLFLHFLFAKDFDLSRRKSSISSNSGPTLRVAQPPPTTAADISADPAPQSPRKPSIPREPLLPSEADILDLDILSQLSFFLPPSSIFRRLRLLYSGNDAGFSMGSFEKSAFNWRAPSILLVSGTLLPSPPKHPRERLFVDSLPPQRLPNSSSKDKSNAGNDDRLIFGAYVPVLWKQTHKTCFGDSSTLLFQLSPMHDVFHASSASTDYIYFNKTPSAAPGLGFGSPCPQQKPTSSYGGQSKLALGPVSLHLDDALEFGVFTHLSSGGGSFLPSSLPSASRAHQDWQDRFEIDALEVWGCGGSEEAEAQRKAWAWEEREAEMRRRVNIGGTGDIEADRELLRMAGIISGDRSGGSMG